jgi:transposase
MSEGIEGLARRLVVGHKRDGRSIYDPQAKAELIEICRRGDVSMAKLARDCGVNANQLNSWVRQHERAVTGRADAAAGEVVEVRSPAFVPVQIEADSTQEPACVIGLQARLPNGVTIDLQELQPRHLADVVSALGRLRCSASTKD